MIAGRGGWGGGTALAGGLDQTGSWQGCWQRKRKVGRGAGRTGWAAQGGWQGTTRNAGWGLAGGEMLAGRLYGRSLFYRQRSFWLFFAGELAGDIGLSATQQVTGWGDGRENPPTSANLADFPGRGLAGAKFLQVPRQVFPCSDVERSAGLSMRPRTDPL